jgi:glycosyltransferase involved in cell wall biosynthesis
LDEEIKRRNIQGKVVNLKYINRDDLIDHYSNAWALLIPLFDDVVSEARFPYKLGEYLLSGRPVVTTNIGVMKEYFADGINGFVSDTCEVRPYGLKIIESLSDIKKSSNVGRAGRNLAIRTLNYQVQSEKYYQFFSMVMGNGNGM